MEQNDQKSIETKRMFFSCGLHLVDTEILNVGQVIVSFDVYCNFKRHQPKD